MKYCVTYQLPEGKKEAITQALQVPILSLISLTYPESGKFSLVYVSPAQQQMVEDILQKAGIPAQVCK